MKLISCLVALGLTSCAYITPRGGSPYFTFHSSQTLGDASGCVVRTLNSEMQPRITHAIQVTDPGRAVEVIPQQTLVIGGEVYYVRVTSSGHGSDVQLYSVATWSKRLANAISGCR